MVTQMWGASPTTDRGERGSGVAVSVVSRSVAGRLLQLAHCCGRERPQVSCRGAVLLVGAVSVRQTHIALVSVFCVLRFAFYFCARKPSFTRRCPATRGHPGPDAMSPLGPGTSSSQWLGGRFARVVRSFHLQVRDRRSTDGRLAGAALE